MKLFPHIIWPTSWRIIAVLLSCYLFHRFSFSPVTDPGAFYSISGVLGSIAGFLLAGVVFLLGASSKAIRLVRERATSGFRSKLFFGVLTIVIFAVLTPIAPSWPSEEAAAAFLVCSVFFVIFEVVMVMWLFIISIKPDTVSSTLTLEEMNEMNSSDENSY